MVLLKSLLTHYYAIDIDEEVKVGKKTGYKSYEYVYFTIPVDNKKGIIMQQTTLAYYLAERGYRHVALPIQNRRGEWITTYHGKDVLVVQAKDPKRFPAKEHGSYLANFHYLLRSHPYEPKSISSYGKWKTLWIQKLTFFENKIMTDAKKYPSTYYRLVMDILPYLIGISENAIQYIQESEREARYDSSDQGTITFLRYRSELLDPIIWPNDLVYDHLSRDIAEYIRGKYLSEAEQCIEEVHVFLKEYESIQPLTPFSWRLVYGRLIFPIHIFDLLERGFQKTTFENLDLHLRSILEKQTRYEQRVSRLLNTEQNNKKLRIPVIQWL